MTFTRTTVIKIKKKTLSKYLYKILLKYTKNNY